MAFTVNLYTTSSDFRQVTKNLSEVADSVKIVPTSSLDILYPTFIVGYNEIYLTANYAYIPFLQRYYYITSYSIEIGKQIRFECSVDVLMSYRDAIRACTACVVRSESIGKPTYTVDSQLPIVQGYYNITSQLFPNSPMNTDATNNFVLTTLGE